jgi:hypothetical protein
MLLLVTRSEESAFFLLNAVATELLPCYHTKRSPT